jgi:hypothetical protein
MDRGILERDTDLLDALLDANYTFTHMTGTRHVKFQWLGQINSGEMRYRTACERGTSVEVNGIYRGSGRAERRRGHHLGQPRDLEPATRHHLTPP